MSNCFVCQQKGKPVKIVTLQNLLKTEVLAKLNTTLNYFFFVVKKIVQLFILINKGKFLSLKN